MQHTICIEGEQLRLIPLEEEHIEKVRNWRNREDIRCWFVSNKVISREQQQEWYKSYLKESGNYVFIIQEKKSGDDVGILSLYNFSENNKEAEFGRFLIGEDSVRGKHYGREALKLICQYACSSMGISRLLLEVYKDNSAAYRVYKECGFREVGEEKQGNRVLVKMERTFNEDF